MAKQAGEELRAPYTRYLSDGLSIMALAHSPASTILHALITLRVDLQLCCKMLGKSMECNPAYFRDILWISLGGERYILDTSATS